MNAKTLVVAGDAERRLIAGTLQTLGFKVLEAGTCNVALEHVSENDLALVIVAADLADIDGIDLARLIHGDRTKAHVPILLMASDETWSRVGSLAFDRGIIDRLRLPFRQSVLRGKAKLYLEMHQSRQLLREKTERLERSNDEFHELAHAAAHDMRAPLRAILGYLNILEEDDPEDRTHFMASIRQATNRMDTMIQGMLAYSEATRGAIDEEVDLDLCVRDALHGLASAIESSHALVAVERLPKVTGNAKQLRQVFESLISNALDFARPEIMLEVTVRARIVGTRVHVEVEDNGTGFDLKWKEEIFRPFRRLVPATEGDGAGVGLAIARRIVEKHSGSISATSYRGHGSTICVKLPMTAEQIERFELGLADRAKAPT
ncbi:MAG: hybrid sensor histidine kinase/response regulator [Deltaproteobacteria bacterium]